MQLIHRFFQLFTLVALDAAADATTTWVIGHQNQITASQRDESGEGCALVATFFFFDLNQQFLAFFDHVLDLGRANFHAFFEVLAGNFLEWQEAMAFFAVIDETGFQRGLDAGDDGLVDVALALFAPFDFSLEVEQFLSVNDGQAPFFRLRGVDQHALHVVSTVQSKPARDGVGKTSITAGLSANGSFHARATK